MSTAEGLGLAGLDLGGACGLAAFAPMTASFVPTIRYYKLPALWALMLPGAALLYGAMALESALNHYRGSGNSWRGRNIGIEDAT